MLDSKHRFEFLEDGIYKLYSKEEGGNWEFDFESRYFVDGSLIGFEYTDMTGSNVREWWDIDSIEGDNMRWPTFHSDSEFNFETGRLELVQYSTNADFRKIRL